MFRSKYVKVENLMDWVNMDHYGRNGSKIWKSFINYLRVISKGLVSKIGNGRTTKFGWEPWMVEEERQTMSYNLILTLNMRGIFYFINVFKGSHLEDESWKNALELVLVGDLGFEWSMYVSIFCEIGIVLLEE